MYGDYDEPAFINPAPTVRPDFQYGPDADKSDNEDDFGDFEPGEVLG